MRCLRTSYWSPRMSLRVRRVGTCRRRERRNLPRADSFQRIHQWLHRFKMCVKLPWARRSPVYWMWIMMSSVIQWVNQMKTTLVLLTAASCTQRRKSKPSARKITNYSASTASSVIDTKIMKLSPLLKPLKSTAPTSVNNRKVRFMSRKSWSRPGMKLRDIYN